MTTNKIQINDQSVNSTKSELEDLSLQEIEKIRGGNDCEDYCEIHTIGRTKWKVCSDSSGDVTWKKQS